MTGARPEAPQYGSLFRALAFVVGLLLLADSLSQLIQVAGSLDAGGREWRLANLRLFFTQVTPLTMGLLLTGQYLVGSGAGWRTAGWLAAALGAVVAVFASVFLADTVAVLGTVTGPALGQLKRSAVQVLLSGGAFALALVLTGVYSLRPRKAA